MENIPKIPYVPPESPDINSMDEDTNTAHSYKEMLLDKKDISETEYYELDLDKSGCELKRQGKPRPNHHLSRG